MGVGSSEETPLGGLWVGVEVAVVVELGVVAVAVVEACDVVDDAVVGAVVEIELESFFVVELVLDAFWDTLNAPFTVDEVTVNLTL